MLVAEQFCHIMKHVHRFTLPEDFAAEATQWDADRWKEVSGCCKDSDADQSLRNFFFSDF